VDPGSRRRDYQDFEAKCYQAQAAHPYQLFKEFDGIIAPGSNEDSALTILWVDGIQSNTVPIKRSCEEDENCGSNKEEGEMEWGEFNE
jgi:hypothetical protein